MLNPEPPAASAALPVRSAAPLTGHGHGAMRRPQPVTASPRPRTGRKILRTAVSAALIAVTFGFALPHFASYRSVWASMQAMAWPQVLLIATAAAISMVTYWIMICAVLPSIRLREAAVVNLGSNAVANTLPAGGALAMGVSWAMLSSWGVSTKEYVLYTLVSGIWNVFVRLGLPVLALLVMVTASQPQPGLIAAAAVGLALLTTAAACLRLLLRSESFALRAGRALQRRTRHRLPAGTPAAALRRAPDLCSASATGQPACSPRAAGGSPSPPWRPSSPCGSSCWLAFAAPACPRHRCPGRPHLRPSRSSGC